MEESSVILSGLKLKRVKQSMNELDFQKIGHNRNIKSVYDYDIDNVSEKIPRIILSYVDYVNTFVWKKMENEKKTILYLGGFLILIKMLLHIGLLIILKFLKH